MDGRHSREAVLAHPHNGLRAVALAAHRTGLAAPWPAGIELNYPKIGVKLVILVVIGGVLGMGSARQRRTGNPVARPLFISVGVLSFAAAAIAVLW